MMQGAPPVQTRNPRCRDGGHDCGSRSTVHPLSGLGRGTTRLVSGGVGMGLGDPRSTSLPGARRRRLRSAHGRCSTHRVTCGMRWRCTVGGSASTHAPGDSGAISGRHEAGGVPCRNGRRGRSRRGERR